MGKPDRNHESDEVNKQRQMDTGIREQQGGWKWAKRKIDET